jgi:cobalt-zinc-cadmium efflux system outer membrane protein
MSPVPIALLLCALPPLTLEQAMSRARAAAPEVQVANRLVQEAEASRVGQGVPFPTNPRLFADYRPLAIELAGQPVDPRNGYNLGLDGTFEVSGAGFARVEEAERRIALAKAELRQEQANAAARAWSAWVEVMLADQRVARLQEMLEVAQRVAAGAKERVNAGVAGDPELTTVEAELAMVKSQHLEAARRQQAARLALAHVLDLSTDEPLELSASTLEPGAVDDEATLLQRALERRPELATLKARLAVLEAMDSRLFREAMPKLGYNFGLDAAPASPVFGYLGLAVEIPVAQRNQGPRAIAAAQRETERARLEAQLRRVQREVALARRNYEARRAQVAVLTTEALPAARRNQTLVEQGWRAGRFDVFRLTTATRDALRLEQERLETLLAAWTDFIELQRASGGLNP